MYTETNALFFSFLYDNINHHHVVQCKNGHHKIISHMSRNASFAPLIIEIAKKQYLLPKVKSNWIGQFFFFFLHHPILIRIVFNFGFVFILNGLVLKTTTKSNNDRKLIVAVAKLRCFSYHIVESFFVFYSCHPYHPAHTYYFLLKFPNSWQPKKRKK